MATPIPDEQAALLAAIVAEPDEDTPRLVYADWLQENGDEEQAQFIRESVALEWLADHEDDQRQRTVKRLADAEGRNGPTWLGALGVTARYSTYDRGMVEDLVYDCFDQFLEDVPILFARIPFRALTISELVPHELNPLAVLADMPELLRLRELRLHNNWAPVSADGFERLVTSPYVANLAVFAVQEAGLTDEDVLAFDRTEHLATLEVLGLASNRLTPAGALTVLRSHRLPNLSRLGFAYNDIEEDRKRGSPYLALRDALIERFDSASALGLSV